MSQCAYHVSTGTPMRHFEVKPAMMLYLALEGDYARLQSRFYRMFGTDSADNLHFYSRKQIERWVRESSVLFFRLHL